MSIMLLLARISCILLEARTVHFCSWIVIEVFTHNSPSPSYFKRGTIHIVILSLNVPLKIRIRSFVIPP